jgi:pilus assembly protein CpaB
MRQRRIVLILAMAVIAAAVAGFSTLRFLSTRPATAVMAPAARKASVVLAVRDLPAGHPVTAQDVRTVEWPAELVPAGYHSQPADVVGRGLMAAVRTNEPLLASKLAEPGSGAGLPIVIPEGRRAMSIPVDQVVGVAGFVIPGTRVDVLLTIQPPNQNEMVTQIILQNLTVLTAGQLTTRNDAGDPMTTNVVTLLVSPQEAERLSLATSQGRIQLALRNMLDVDDAITSGVRVTGLLNSDARRPATTATRPAPPPAPRPEPAVVEVYKGGTRSIQRF